MAVPQALQPQFSIGSILRQALSVYGSRWGAFLTLMALASVPALAAKLLLDSGPFTTNLIGFVTQPLAAGAVFFIVFEALHGRQASVPAGLRAVSANLFQVVGASLLSDLVIMAGTILCIVPGVIAFGLLALVVPVVMQENLGVVAALRRSAALAQGYRGQVVGVVFTPWLICAVLVIAIVLIVGPSHFTVTATRELYIAGALVGIVVGGLNATAIALMYDRLRKLKEESSAAGQVAPLSPWAL